MKLFDAIYRKGNIFVTHEEDVIWLVIGRSVRLRDGKIEGDENLYEDW